MFATRISVNEIKDAKETGREEISVMVFSELRKIKAEKIWWHRSW